MVLCILNVHICLYMYVVYVDRLPPNVNVWSPEKSLIWGGGGCW